MTQQPAGDINTLTGQLARSVDQRVAAGIREHSQRTFGIPRSRGMTLNCPLAGSQLTPTPGWVQSVVVFHTCRVVSWEICSLVPGSVSVDIRVSGIPSSPSTVPTLTSLPGAAHYLTLNGYATASFDTSQWVQREIQAGSVLHIYIISASGILQTIMGLQLMDLYGRLLQT